MKYSNINTKMRYSAPYGNAIIEQERKSRTAPAHGKTMHARATPTDADRAKRVNALLRTIAAMK